jgi:hypothetical protein
LAALKKTGFAGPEAGFPMADFGGVWGRIKKEFFIAAKKTIFEQVLKILRKPSLQPMDSGLMATPHFLFSARFWSKSGSK